MKPFIITYDNAMSKPEAKYWIFRIYEGERQVPMAVSLIEEVKTQYNELPDGIFIQLGLSRIKGLLGLGEYNRILQEYKHTNKHFAITISQDDIPSGFSPAPKNCKYHRQNINGSLCGIGNHGDNITTPQFCEECAMPDESLMCSYLVHPTSQCYRASPTKIERRDIIEAYCEKGTSFKDGHDVMICRPVTRPCWKQIYEIPQPVINIPVDLPGRVVDEVDFLNLLFGKKYSGQFIGISQARSIRDIGNDCKTEEEFNHKVQVVAHLINDIRVRDILPPQKQVDKDGNKILSMASLKIFLTDNHPGYSPIIISNLENIRTIRNDYPAHAQTRKDVTVSLDALQINYPIQNWQDAWQKVLYAFWGSLNKLRLLIQYN